MEWKKLALAPGLLALLTVCAGAQEVAKPADDEQMHGNVRCLVVSLAMAGATTGPTQTAALVSTFYWLGRVDSQVPPSDLEGRLVVEFPSLSKPDFVKSEGLRCGEEMKARGQALTDLGKDIQQRAGEILPKTDGQ